MPAQAAGGPPAGGSAPAKTMFGYAAPVMPQRPPAGGPPPAQPGYPPPAAPPQPQYGQPPAPQPQYGQPPAPQPQYGQPPAPQPQYGQPPAPQPQYGQPPQPQYGQPPAPQPQFGQPPQPQFGQPPQPQFGQPPQPQYGQPQHAPPAQPQYGQPPQPMGGPPPGAPPGYSPQPVGGPPGYSPQPVGGPPGYPPAPQPMGGPPPGAPPQYGQPQGNPFAPPQQDLPGGMDDFARRLPQSAPGTLFGIPLSTLRDVGLQRKALFFLGIALVASIFVPASLKPFAFWFKLSFFHGLLWPAIAGGAYLLVAAAPPDIRNKVPPVVLEWLPFGISYYGVFEYFSSFGAGHIGSFLPFGLATLMFGLLSRLMRPDDQTARIIIAVGSGLLVLPMLDSISPAFGFHGGIFNIISNLLSFIVMVLAVACILFFIPAKKLPPALQAIDAFAPHITAIIILWMPVMIVLAILEGIVHGHVLLGSILIGAHLLLGYLAYFGVLMLTAPAAYDAVMNMINKKGSPPPQQQPPQQGGGYPPQGGGYPPQGGGYPPQGGGYPPQGGYPPG